MANIPFLTIISTLIVCASSFTVPHINENPDLFIDDQLNLVEPKLDFWNVFLRPKTKSSFKNIVKMINNFDARNKYVVGYNPQPVSHLEVVPEELNRNSEVDETQYLIQEGNPSIVSKEVDSKENSSEDDSHQVAVGISLESKSDTSENYQSKETSTQSKGSSEIQTKKETEEVNKEESKSLSEDVSEAKNSESLSKEESPEATKSSNTVPDLKQEPIRYRPSLPKSLHYIEIDRPRYQHSIRDGWVF